MKTRCTLMLVIAFFLLNATICWADEPKDHICFNVLDANNDGMVTFKEFEPYYGNDRKTFNAADEDNDSVLTHDEYHDLLGHGSSSQK